MMEEVGIAQVSTRRIPKVVLKIYQNYIKDSPTFPEKKTHFFNIGEVEFVQTTMNRTIEIAARLPATEHQEH